jgi:hypothetical protein
MFRAFPTLAERFRTILPVTERPALTDPEVRASLDVIFPRG